MQCGQHHRGGCILSGDTIAAIATPPGVGGIGIVRLSGPEAFAIGRRLFKRSGRSERSPRRPASHLLTHGYVVDPAGGERIDEVLAVFMRAPQHLHASRTSWSSRLTAVH